jgi:hypothetical protein
MPTTTSNNFLPFTSPVKLYVFNAENTVQLSFRVSDTCVITEQLSIDHFQHIVDNWKEGVDGLETWMGKVWWELRNCGPRPEMNPAEFVAINFSVWNFRITVSDMEDVITSYNKQLIV